jgi:hypothetical protein
MNEQELTSCDVPEIDVPGSLRLDSSTWLSLGGHFLSDCSVLLLFTHTQGETGRWGYLFLYLKELQASKAGAFWF